MKIKSLKFFNKASVLLILSIISYIPIMWLRFVWIYGMHIFGRWSWNSLPREFYETIWILIVVVSINLPILFSVILIRRKGRKTAVVLFLIMLAIWKYPVRNYARLAYLKDNIEVFNSAVSYVLEEAGERRKNMQIIAIPEEYGVTTYWSGYEGNPDYVYFMKDKNTIKIFFYKAGLIYEKGYLYAINLPECSEPYKKSMALFGADIKSDNGGVWDWAEYDRADLPNYNDRNWR